MAGNQEILREYLVSLGYSIDTNSQKKFDTSLGKTKFNVDGLLKTLIGVGAAAQAMVVLYARSMERLYWASQRAETSASSLQALEFAGKNIGITGDAMSGAIEGMARALRSNPGLTALIESFGIKTQGRERADVMIDLVDKLRKMPFAIGSQFASMFGIDADTFFMLSKNLDVLKEQERVRKEMNKDAGLDVDAAAAAGKEYAQQLRDIQALFGVLKDTVSLALLPAFKEAAGVTKEVLSDWTKIIRQQSSPNSQSTSSFLWSLVEGVFGKSPQRVFLRPEAQRRVTAGETAGVSNNSLLGASSYFSRKSFGGTAEPTDRLFDRLESQWGLPTGLLDKMWNQESGRGTHMLSPAGARGHFGFMDKTAKQYGVDPNDLASSASGAARYLHDLLSKYNGSLPSALAGYNWGPGNVDQYGLGRAPKETRDYVQSLTGRPIQVNQETNITVNSPDPNSAGTSVGNAQRGVTADMVRNLRSNLQ